MEIRESESTRIAVIGPRFDGSTAPDVEAALKQLVEQGVDQILCDFSDTDYISSAGFRVLLATAKNLSNMGGGLVLCQLRPMVRDLFNTSGFNQIFTICDTQQEAIQQLATSEPSTT